MMKKFALTRTVCFCLIVVQLVFGFFVQVELSSANNKSNGRPNRPKAPQNQGNGGNRGSGIPLR